MSEKQKPVAPEQVQDNASEKDAPRHAEFMGKAGSIIESLYDGAKDLNDEDREAVQVHIASELRTISDKYANRPEVRKKKLSELLDALEGVSPNEAKNKTEAGARPELPTTEELEDTKNEMNENPGKVSVLRRAQKALLGARDAVTIYGPFGAIRKAFEVKRKDGEADDEFEKRKKSKTRKRVLGAAALVGALGAAYMFRDNIADGIDHMREGFSGGSDLNADGNSVLDMDIPGENTGADSGSESGDSVYDNWSEDPHADGFELDLASFEYNFDNDPFNDADKLGPNNWGNAIELAENSTPEDMLDGQLERLARSPEQLATVMAESKQFDEFTTGNIEVMAERMKADPEFFMESYDRLVELTEDPEIKLTASSAEPGTYGSYYGVDMDGDIVMSYDNHVDQPATTLVWEFADGEVMETKMECGGQVIDRHEVTQVQHTPQAVGGGESAPQGGGYVPPVGGGETPPIGGGETPPVTPPEGGGETPPVIPPEGGGETPPTGGGETPPEGGGETPPVIPEKPETPEVDDSKDWDLVPDEPGWTPDYTLYEQTEDPAIVGNGTGSENLDPSHTPGSQVENVTAPEANQGTGGTREEQNVVDYGNSGYDGGAAAEADLGQSWESATENATVEAPATTDDNAGQEITNPF